MDTKKPWESKTLWLGAVTAILPLVFPPAAAWVAANPEIFSAGVSAVFSALRLISKDQITIS